VKVIETGDRVGNAGRYRRTRTTATLGATLDPVLHAAGTSDRSSKNVAVVPDAIALQAPDGGVDLGLQRGGVVSGARHGYASAWSASLTTAILAA